MDRHQAGTGTTKSRGGAAPPLWLALLLGALAGGMGWGIRGQYGHETGAMIAGVLIGFVVIVLFCREWKSLDAARVVALVAIGISFGGSMTYGQTVGLTHDREILGNWPALRWGMLGLFIKGGVWFGFAGAFLGMGLGRQRYRARETFLIFAGLVALFFLGVYLINQPFDPAQRKLPSIYFSDDWHWEPEKPDLKPRFECWGGLLTALLGLGIYFALIKRDRLARNLTVCGFLAGAVGFPIGQSVQAFHAWNPDAFDMAWFASIYPHMNWWNLMEIVFGAVAGCGLLFGVWLHRDAIAVGGSDPEVSIAPRFDFVLVVVHAIALVASGLLSLGSFDAVTDLGLTMGILPAVGVLCGRWWPYVLAFPLVALPIAGKTLRHMAYRNEHLDVLTGWVLLVVLPLSVLAGLALLFESRGRRGETGGAFGARGLVIATWFYFAINFVFFEFPWPWSAMTSRSPSAWILFVCALGLTFGALVVRRRGGND